MIVLLAPLVAGCMEEIHIVQLEQGEFATGVVQEGQTFYLTSKEDTRNEFAQLRCAHLVDNSNAIGLIRSCVGYWLVLGGV